MMEAKNPALLLKEKNSEIIENGVDVNDKAYDEYMEGEEPYEDEDAVTWQAIKDYWYKQYELTEQYFLILFDQYPLDHLKDIKNYNLEASRALFELCQGRKLMAYQVIRLIESGANVNYQCPKSCETCLHWIARRGNYVIMKVLLAAGGDMFILDTRHRNVLMLACDSALPEQARLVNCLLWSQKGIRAKLETRDAAGCSALLNAVFKSNVWIVRELLLAGASVVEKGEINTSAYDAALWIVATGLMMDVDQLPKRAITPDSFLYRWFSPKGYYDSKIAVYIQNLYKYNADLVFRMIQRRHYDEVKYYKPPAPPKPYKAPPDPERVRRRLDAKRREKKIKKLLQRYDTRDIHQLDHWNNIRKNIAKRLDSEYAKFLRGNGEEPHEWVRLEKKKGMDWKMQTKTGKSVYGKSPSKAIDIRFQDITIQQKISQFHNATHDEPDRLDFEHKQDPLHSYARRLGLDSPSRTKLYWKVSKEKGLREPQNLGYYDLESRWAKLRQETILIAPEEIDSDEDFSDYKPKKKEAGVGLKEDIEYSDESDLSDDDEEKGDNNNELHIVNIE